MTKSNESWNQLCNLATELLPQYRDRPDALQAAIRQHPDLAAKAVDPTGKPVIPGAVAEPVKTVATQGKAKPWHEVLKAMGIAKAGEPPAAIGPRPWRAILAALGLRPAAASATDSATGGQRPASETPSSGARPWSEVLREVEAERRAAR
jgi:hypothetical protein